jgi:hypothetical protein
VPADSCGSRWSQPTKTTHQQPTNNPSTTHQQPTNNRCCRCACLPLTARPPAVGVDARSFLFCPPSAHLLPTFCPPSAHLRPTFCPPSTHLCLPTAVGVDARPDGQKPPLLRWSAEGGEGCVGEAWLRLLWAWLARQPPGSLKQCVGLPLLPVSSTVAVTVADTIAVAVTIVIQ